MDGAMIGRAAYHAPGEVLLEADARVFADPIGRSAVDVALMMQPYITDHLQSGGKLHHVTRHMLGLFQGRPGARLWRRHLSENAHRTDADWRVVEEALGYVQAAAA